MKKLLSTIIIAMFAISVNAQIPLSNQLTCTEQAFNLRLDIRSGLNPGVVKVGSAQLANYAVTPAVNYFPVNHNMQKPGKLGSPYFYPDNQPTRNGQRVFLDKNSTSIFGSYNKPAIRFDDSINFPHNHK